MRYAGFELHGIQTNRKRGTSTYLYLATCENKSSESYCNDIADMEIDIEKDVPEETMSSFFKVSKESHKNELKKTFADIKDKNKVR